MVAALLSTLVAMPLTVGKRVAYAALIVGLVALLAANLGRQQKFAARSEMLWQALEYVERQAPQGACVQWVGSKQLEIEEGIHFQWHLAARGRGDIHIQLVDAAGNPVQRSEVRGLRAMPSWRMVGGERPADAGDVLQCFTASYHLGCKRFTCCLEAL